MIKRLKEDIEFSKMTGHSCLGVDLINLDKLIAVVESVEIARRHSSDPSYLPDVWAAYAALEEE